MNKTLGEQAAEKQMNEGQLVVNGMFTPTRVRKIIEHNAQIIDTLHAQQPCGCEKLREEAQRILTCETAYYEDLLKLCEALAQPCQQASVGSEEEWTYNYESGYWAICLGREIINDKTFSGPQIGIAMTEKSAKDICAAHNAALRRSAPVEAWRDALIQAAKATAARCGQSTRLSEGFHYLADELQRRVSVAQKEKQK